MIRYSTLTVPADAEPGTLVTILSVTDNKGQPIPARFVLATPGLFVISGDALLTGQWDTPPTPGNYAAHVTASSVAGGTQLGGVAIVVNIVRPLGGKITAKRPDGTVITGAPNDLIFIPAP